MILRIIIVIVVLIAAVLAFAATKPATFRVQRSIGIQASPEKVFALLDDFHNWGAWAPQDREDPTMSRTYSGAARGKGAISEWAGKGSAGQGRMEITESALPSRVSVKVDFVRPFEAHNINEFTLEPDGALTKIVWTMNGTNLYLMKVMSIFVNMDREAGKHFESGLNNLKVAAER